MGLFLLSFGWPVLEAARTAGNGHGPLPCLHTERPPRALHPTPAAANKVIIFDPSWNPAVDLRAWGGGYGAGHAVRGMRRNPLPRTGACPEECLSAAPCPGMLHARLPARLPTLVQRRRTAHSGWASSGTSACTASLLQAGSGWAGVLRGDCQRRWSSLRLRLRLPPLRALLHAAAAAGAGASQSPGRTQTLADQSPPAGTMEEMIYSRQLYKQQHSHMVLEGARMPRMWAGEPGLGWGGRAGMGWLHCAAACSPRVQQGWRSWV